MDFEPLPGVTRAAVVIDLADGTRYTYVLSAAGAKIGFDSGDRWDRTLDLDLGPELLHEVPRVYPVQIAFAFPLSTEPRSRSQVTLSKTLAGDDRTPFQADRDRAGETGAWPEGWGPFHRHFAGDAIHRDGGEECDQQGTPRRVYMFDPDILDAHERAVAQWAAATLPLPPVTAGGPGGASPEHPGPGGATGGPR